MLEFTAKYARLWQVAVVATAFSIAYGIFGVGTPAEGQVTVRGSVTTLVTLNVPPTVIAISNDDQTVYVADAYAHEVDQVNVATGQMSIFAGDGTAGWTGDDGPATAAELNYPEYLAVDTWGNVLIADLDEQVIRLVAGQDCNSNCPYGLTSMVSGDIYTVAGNGMSPSTRPATGPATATNLQMMGSNWNTIGVDQFGDAIVNDLGPEADISLIAGTSCPSATLATCPYGLSSMTAGYIYWLAGNDYRGLASQKDSGNGGPATSALLVTPEAFVVDSSHDLIYGDTSTNQIRMIAGYSCSSNCPWGFTSLTAGDIYTIANYNDAPEVLSLDPSGNLLIGNSLNFDAAVIAASNCSAACPYGVSSMVEGQGYNLEGGGMATTVNGLLESHLRALTQSVTIGEVGGFVFDRSGDIIVGDLTNDAIDKVTPSSPATSTSSPATSTSSPATSRRVAKATSKTTLKLSATKVTYGHEQTEHLSVRVSPEFARTTPTGTVRVKQSTRTLCVITLKSAKGSCKLSAKRLKVGTYHPVATYGGSTNFKGSTSAKETLRVVT
jgi:hypothetical protein